MRYFQRIAWGVDVMPLLHRLQRNPQLWDEHPWRRTYAGTPHANVQDIWLRYSSTEVAGKPDDNLKVMADTEPVWYDTIKALPEVRGIVLDLMRRVSAYQLGRLIITRVSPGRSIAPHADTGAAYADIEDGGRYHVVLQSAPGSLFRAGDEQVCMAAGDVWWFDHRTIHSVVNNSAVDRIHLIADLRTF